VKQHPTDFHVQRNRCLLSVGCRYQQTLDLRVIPGFRCCVMRSSFFWDVTQRTLVLVTDVFGWIYLSDLEGSSSPRIIPIPKKCRTQHHWLSLKYALASCFNLGDGNDRLSRNAGNQINTNHICCVTFQNSKYLNTGALFTGLYSFTQNSSLTEFILTLIYYENIILKWDKCACRTKTLTALC